MSKEINLEKLASIPMIMFIKANEEKNKIGFYWNKTKRQEIYTLDLKTSEYKQITDGHLPRALRAGFLWTKDDKHFVYTKDMNGDEQHNIYLFNIDKKESIQLTETPNAQETPRAISPEGGRILFSSNRHDQMNLFIMDLETKDIQQLTAHDKPTMGTSKWSKTGWIYYDFNESLNFKNNDVWGIKEDGSEVKKVFSVSDQSNDTFYDINDDGTLLAITSNHIGINQAGIFDVEKKEIKWLSDGKYDETAVQFSKDSTKMLVMQNKEAELIPIVYDINTGQRRELDFSGVVSGITFCLDDKYLAYVRNDPKTPIILAKYDLERNQEEMIIPPQVELNAEDFYDSEYVKFKSYDGLEIAAILHKPKIEPGKKYPALVDVHGGPTGQVFRNFNVTSQVFAHEGFVIINPNFRGSTGYGKEFMEMNLKDWGGGDAQDVIYAKKYLEQLDYVDPERIGVFGGSYGGYMTFIQLTKFADEGWKTGSAWIGMTDLKKLYDHSQSHFKFILINYLGKYEENKQVWEEGSAINYIEKMKTPMQIIHGVNDPRCPINQARDFRDKLISLGWKEAKEGEKTFEYIEFGDEGHGGFSDIGMRIRTYKHFIDYFKRRL